MCHEAPGKSIDDPCATQQIPAIMKPSAYRSAWTPLEKVATIAYLFMRAARILAHPGPGLAGAGWRISKVMGIQDFVLVPGFAPAAPDAAKAMPGLVGAAAMTNEEKPGPAPLMLQYHGNPVRFRNVWIRPLAEAQ